jgi:hypothetical protein
LPEDFVVLQKDVHHVLAVNRTPRPGFSALLASSFWAISAMNKILLAEGIVSSAAIDLPSTVTHQ